MRVNAWLNIYRSGYFHTPGKLLAYDRHAGDCYATREAALAAIDPPSHYVATVPVAWDDAAVISPNMETHK